MSHGEEAPVDDRLTLDADGGALFRGLLIAGVLGLGGALLLGMADRAKLQRAYLVAFMYVLSIALGAL